VLWEQRKEERTGFIFLNAGREKKMFLTKQTHFKIACKIFADMDLQQKIP